MFGKERKCFGVVSGARFSMKADQASISHGARGLGMGLNPFEHFPVTFAGGLQQGIGIESKKLHQVLVGWNYIYSPFFPARVARPLSSMRPKPRSCPNERESSGVGVSQINKKCWVFILS